MVNETPHIDAAHWNQVFRGMRRASPVLDKLIAFALLAALFALAHHLAGRFGPEQAVVGSTFAVDGDTLDVQGVRVRLSGIDAPERQQTCGAPGREWPCGAEARSVLDAAVKHAIVRCEGRARDAYHRLIAACRVGDVDLAEDVVRAGLALSTGAYEAIEGEARAAGRGIWSGPFERPAEWRAAHPR